MCDHRALWPHGCMSSSLVWIRRHEPSHPWTSTLGPLCDKPQPTATHSQTRKWQPLGWLLTPRSPVKKWSIFPFTPLQREPRLPPPWEWATVRLRTCHVHVNKHIRICTSVICGPGASDSCCHLLDSWLSSLQWHKWRCHQLQKRNKHSVNYLKIRFFISLLMIWRWGKMWYGS